jgi:hypothetical protein
MRNGGRSELVATWLDRLEEKVPSSEIASRAESVAYQQWFEKASERDNARRQRLLEAGGTLPALLWVMLVIGAVAVVGFVLLYADPAERALGQAFFAAGVTAVVVTSLLAVAALHQPLAPPCDAAGNPA